MLIRWTHDGKSTVHPFVGPTSLPIGDLLELERQTTAAGYPVNLGLLEEWQAEVDKIKGATKEETQHLRGVHPRGMMLWSVNIWASLRGDTGMSFDDFTRTVMPDQITYIQQDGDPDELRDAVDPTRRHAPRTGSAKATRKAAPKKAGAKAVTRRR